MVKRDNSYINFVIIMISVYLILLTTMIKEPIFIKGIFIIVIIIIDILNIVCICRKPIALDRIIKVNIHDLYDIGNLTQVKYINNESYIFFISTGYRYINGEYEVICRSLDDACFSENVPVKKCELASKSDIDKYYKAVREKMGD